MSPIRFFLTATLGIHLLSDCTSPETTLDKQNLLLDWVTRMKEAHEDLLHIKQRGDVFDNDFAISLHVLQQACSLCSEFLEPDIRLQTESILQEYETLFKHWNTKGSPDVLRNLATAGETQVNTLDEQQLHRQNNDAAVEQAHIQHVYDMPEFALELLNSFHKVTRGFNRIIDKKDIFIDVDQVSEFVTCAIDGLVEQMNIEYQLPERAEQLLQARIQLLIVEIRLAVPIFSRVNTGWLNADEILLVVASKLESSLLTRKLLTKPKLTLVKINE